MKLNKREEFMLWKLMEFSLHRYLLSLKRSGAERAERHIEISKLIWEIQNLKTATGADWKDYIKIHGLIAEEITDHLDKTIDLDLDLEQSEWNYDLLVDRFFKKILKII